ncbi:MAG: YbaB/EbfC family nucleoid-associated protein [Spirochaetaceae bacterium]|jgi:DNA-binding YbaB/EbfC family protein|nr:YbaB/EbfC family nucleoid-associated protein [Spirochaetaceae bacterium]
MENLDISGLLSNMGKLQEQTNKFNAKLAELSVTGAAGGGMVEIDMNGLSEMKDVRISPEIAGDVDMLQDLIIAAYENAKEKTKQATMSAISEISGLNSGHLSSILSMLNLNKR